MSNAVDDETKKFERLLAAVYKLGQDLHGQGVIDLEESKWELPRRRLKDQTREPVMMLGKKKGPNKWMGAPDQLDRILRKVAVLKWMVAANIGLTATILGKLLVVSLALPICYPAVLRLDIM
jgi:hypothetical protein